MTVFSPSANDAIIRIVQLREAKSFLETTPGIYLLNQENRKALLRNLDDELTYRKEMICTALGLENN